MFTLTFLELPEITEVTFDYLSMDKNFTIASLSQVAADQLVRVKGTVKELSGVKNVIFDKNSVKKQQCYIVDPSGFLKLIIWGSHVNKVEEGGTYIFDKVRVKVTKSERYVNTPKSECECTITPADPFTESLPDVEAVSTISEITANILGVSNAVKSMCCFCCGKKVAMKGKLAFCESCKMCQKLESCKMQWYVRICVEKVRVPEQRLRLTAFNDVSNQLLEICNLPPTSSEEELTESILQLDTVLISFDEQTNKLIDITVVNI